MTYAETQKELEKEWIWIDPDQSWQGKYVARRLGIHQGGKTRSRPCGAVGMVASFDPLTDAGGGSNPRWSTGKA